MKLSFVGFLSLLLTHLCFSGTPMDTPLTTQTSLLATHASVFAVEKNYQITALVSAECTMWVEIDGKSYFDHSNGILRSGRFLHKVSVPMKVLDCAEKYTLCLQRINERKPYFTDFGEIEKTDYSFRPIKPKAQYNIMNVADTHCLVSAPIKSGSYFGEQLDLLVLNGDIPNHSGDINYFKAIYLISGAITKGEIPCIFSRGNHDMRGIYAEQLEDYTPTHLGKSYFTFSLGPIWGIVLDTGEDKADSSNEYGRTICCSQFREEEELFIDQVLQEKEFLEKDIRIIISHNPFAHKLMPPFDIEQERYARWCKKLAELNATVWLTGHLHECFFEQKGGVHDTYGYPSPLICSSLVKIKSENDEGSHTAGAVTISNDGKIRVKFVSDDGSVSLP